MIRRATQFPAIRSCRQVLPVASWVGVIAVVLTSVGCVGPMACGPMGCGANGPLVMNDCDGCDSCSGCGELYIDPWVNHPADACDPCDRCGNFNGQSCGKCRSVFGGVASLWGYRCDSGCDTSCSSCEVPCGTGGLYVGGECGNSSCDGMSCGCGVEASCGIEDCGGCDHCSGGMTLSGQPTLEPGVVLMDPSQGSGSRHLAKPYQPKKTRQIFQSRSANSDSHSVSKQF